MTRSLEEHAENWDLRHDDFNDNDFLYDVYSVMRERTAFSHTNTPVHPLRVPSPDGQACRRASDGLCK
jgi:hypothetical protein